MSVYSSPVYLNPRGWSLSSEPLTLDLLGIWTNKSDRVIAKTSTFAGITNSSLVNTGRGNDYIDGGGSYFGIYNAFGAKLDTGYGNDFLSGGGNDGRARDGISNYGTIDTGYGNDTIIGTVSSVGVVGIDNSGTIDTGNGNDTIWGSAEATDYGIVNYSGATIDTGNGNDIITGIGAAAAIVNDGTIKTGDGNDKVFATQGFRGEGSLFLEGCNDYLKGFGSGKFYGGGGKDVLELATGTYTVGISEATVSFTDVNHPFITMNTSEFERLIVGGKTYSFANLPSTVFG